MMIRNVLAVSAAFSAVMMMIASPAHAQPADPARVRGIIESCMPCHGADGIAKDTEVPHLAGQNEEYLQKQLENFRSGRRRHKEMRYVAGELTPAEMDAIAAYFASLPRQ
ncbi:MAG: c-type cytochrome [Beijerinckiaceae bacterium]